jgi:predicted alpha/beta-fold hydrolase
LKEPRIGSFRPAFGLGGPFRQTVAATLLPARYPVTLPPAERRTIRLRPQDALSVLVTPSATSEPRGRLVLLHGLGGSATSRYMLRTTEAAWHRGWEVARVNFRGAEPDAPPSRTFHNAQRSEDLEAALRSLGWGSRPARDPERAAAGAGQGCPVVAVGFSLGGAILLRHLALAGAQSPLDAAVAVSPPVDLGRCLEALERPRNRVYHHYYVQRLRRQALRKVAAFPELFAGRPPRLDSIRIIDELFVAPDAGYSSAEAYYAGASVLPLLGGIEVPTLILTSRDDPFIPAALFEGLAAEGRSLATVITEAGGHVGYLSGGPLGGFRFWAASALLDWLESDAAPSRLS